MISCKNCENSFEGNFCNHCGQKAKTERLDWHYLSDEAKYTFLHFNGGLTYSVKQLATRPGHTIREFIEGKRVKHYKPVLLLFVLAGIYGLLMHYIDLSRFFESMQSPEVSDQKAKLILQMQNQIYQWMVGHYSMVEIILLPILSLASWLAFRSWGYNYIEHFIFNSFTASLRLIYYIVLFPVLFATSGLEYAVILHTLFSIPAYGLSFWCYLQFYKGREPGPLILRLLGTAALSIFFLAILTVSSVMVYILANKEQFEALAR